MTNRTYLPLHVASPRPYYIFAPPYRQNSAGIRVMHLLCHLLNRCGQDAYLFATETNPQWHTPLLTDVLQQQHAQAGREPIVVYPEVVPGNPANAQSVVRYLLNVPGLLGGDTQFSSSELIFAYTQNLLPEGLGSERLLFMPPIDTSIFHNRDNLYDQHRKGWLIYPGRHVDALKQHPELAAKCTVITSKWPSSPTEMANLFRQSERVYCFSSTAIALEAILCGCPAVVLKSPFFDGVHLGADEFGTYGLAFDDAPEQIQRAQDGLVIAQEKYVALQNRFWDQLAIFIETSQAMPSVASLARNLQASEPVTPRHGQQEQNLAIERWLRQRSPTEAQAALMAQRLEERQFDLPRFDFVIVPDGRPAAIEITRTSLQAQSYQHIEVHEAANADATTLNDLVVRQGVGQWLCFVRAGTTFTPFGLLVLALELLDAMNVRAVYADEIVSTPEGDLDTLLRPDFNLDMFLSCPANMASHWFYRRDVFLNAGGFDPECAGATELALLLKLIEDSDGLDGLAHVSEPVCVSTVTGPAHSPQEQAVLLQHLHRRGYVQARVQMHRPGIHRVHYGHADSPLVSVVIVVNDRLDRVQRCVSSLIGNTSYSHYEVLLVDNGCVDVGVRTWLDGLMAQHVGNVRLLRNECALDHGVAHNLAVRHARGDYLMLLHSDTVVVQADWLEALLNHAQRPEVGIVGAKLLRPDGTVEQAGTVLGLAGPAHSAFSGQANDGGYMQRLEMDQNYSAVSDACLMIRRALYEAVDGMDTAHLHGSCAVVDLCLKSAQAGYLTVWTPHAVVSYDEQQMQGASVPATEAEEDALYFKWLALIARDPAYNRNLSLQGSGFELETDPAKVCSPLAWRPQPVVLAMPGDLGVSGHSRIVDPALSMTISGMADVRLSLRSYLPAELERLQPDAWVMQRQVSETQIQALRRNSLFTRAFKVADVDALLPGATAEYMSGVDTCEAIQGALHHFVGLTDRLVVSSEVLAEVLQGSSGDIRVLTDRLHPARWGALQSRRGMSVRPRLGWVGEPAGADMQALMMEVVEALHGEVDWVCLGECAPQIRPYLKEHHDAVPVDEYPRKLSSLNLDLALAPLGDGLLNACRSNLRLLEYAACGYPVVCSDVPPYHGLPVTRVRNTSRDWQSAIRMHLGELKASAREADNLRETVLAHWMLDERYAQQWLKAWLPD